MINPTSDHPTDHRRFSLALGGLYSGLFLGFGLYLPFFPVWLAERGLSADAIGLVLAGVTCMRILTVPLVTRLADLGGSLSQAIVVSTFACMVLFPAVGFARDVPTIMLTLALVCIVWNPLLPLTDAYGLAGVARRGLDYGRIRMFGSIAFMAANVGGGYAVAKFGGTVVVWMICGTLVLAVLAALALVPDRSLPDVPLRQRGSVRSLIRPRFGLIMLAAAVIQGSHALFYGFGSLHWRGQGFSDEWIGLLWALGVLSEIGLFWMATAIGSRLTPLRLILIGGLGAVVRWGLSAVDLPMAMQAPLQVLHAASFGLSHLGAMFFLQAAVPTHARASGQGLFTTLSGATMALSSLASGWLYQRLGGTAYLVMGGAALFGTVLIGLAALLPSQPQKDATGG